MHTSEIPPYVHPSDIEESPFGLEQEIQSETRPDRPSVEHEPVSFAQTLTAPISADAALDVGQALDIVGTMGGNGSYEHPVFGFGILDPDREEHPTGGLCKACLNKDPKKETKLDKLWVNLDTKAEDGRWLYRGWLAVNCCDACYEDAKQDHARLRHNIALWNATCPTEFRGDWDHKKGSNALFKRVMDWAKLWNVDERQAPTKGLMIFGQTDTAKTRVCWHLYKRLAEEGVGVMFTEAIDLLQSIPNEAYTVGVLIIDDLGNDQMDYRSEVRLLKLLRSRAQWHRPVVITSQFDGKDLAARFKQEATGQAVVRRLREFCDPIYARKAGEGGISRDSEGRAVVQ